MYFLIEDPEKQIFPVFMSESIHAKNGILQSDSVSEVYTYFKNTAMTQYI